MAHFNFYFMSKLGSGSDLKWTSIDQNPVMIDVFYLLAGNSIADVRILSEKLGQANILRF